MWGIVAARPRYRWEHGGRGDEEEEQPNEHRYDVCHDAVEVVEEDEEPGEEQYSRDEVKDRDNSHDGFHMPFLEVVIAILSSARNVPRNPIEAGAVFLQPLLDDDSDRSGREAEYKTSEPESVEPDRVEGRLELRRS